MIESKVYCDGCGCDCSDNYYIHTRTIPVCEDCRVRDCLDVREEEYELCYHCDIAALEVYGEFDEDL